MAEALSERELRRILRDKARERILQQEKERKEEQERQRWTDIERIEYEEMQYQIPENIFVTDHGNEINQSNGNESDRESDISELDTTDEFLHDSTARDIQEMQCYKAPSLQSQRNESNSMERETRQDGSSTDRQNSIREGRSGYTHKIVTLKKEDSKDRKGARESKQTEVKADRNQEYTYYRNYEKEGKSLLRSNTERKVYKGEQRVRDISLEVDKVKHEMEEIRSQSSKYERQSLKLRKLQLEEEQKQQLIKENDRKLQEEIENKKRAEQELIEIEKINLLEWKTGKRNVCQEKGGRNIKYEN
ncbi:trichohyalin-like [Mercenaria mercenaria]|uniref:trichohyalin-like n=1 Tax=Mercenaria mercenaria TaxID=6596 RepID=UPI00234EB082|nr:trichohyalin-like [Mercenaria mercenaria]